MAPLTFPSSFIATPRRRVDVVVVVVPLARREENAADGRYLRTMSRTIANAFPVTFATGPDAAPLAARRTC
jgi:hypothetical protein